MVRKLAGFLVAETARIRSEGEGFGRTILPLAHQRFPIGPDERDAWLACMRAALEDGGVDEDAAAMLMAALSPLADACRSDDEGV